MSARMLSCFLGWALATSCSARPLPEEPSDTLSSTTLMVHSVYYHCKGTLGPIAQAIILADVVAVVQGFFTTAEDKLAFALLVCIESRFLPSARSTAGAVGLTQVLPRYANEFSSRCYLGTKPIDIWVPRVNLMTGACYYKHLLKQFRGNYALALAGYNAGENSPTVKRLQSMQKINPETADYIARFMFLKEEYLRANKNPVLQKTGTPDI